MRVAGPGLSQCRRACKPSLWYFIEHDEIWVQLVDNMEARKNFLTNLQMLFLNEIENSTLIELATTKWGND
jgi:hypothetical protein